MDTKYIAATATTPEIARFDFSRPNSKTDIRINSIAKMLYNMPAFHVVVNGVITPFIDLTRKEKLDIVGQYLEQILKDLAKNQHVREAVLNAESIATLDFETNT